ncbi:hypothetical protein EZJ19_12040 [Parasulfuritortus cantonensis]|uniref:Uncharacterized protein n=1 Tax=Parasulfuritortus cantonensis TaxID=2528202 RepID=A0A4R1B842_9PROT|nr:MalM family protein [Parasulfuritortus cantonensis]TCJ12948.1 hypothetical protein EZJ19_12040 [Parasulfuritortus cantonensis]
MPSAFARLSMPIAAILLSFVLLAGCSGLGVQPGGSLPEGEALVFGRILLDRDGELSSVSTFSNHVEIRNLETDDVQLVAQPFEPDGRFYWSLPPGRYQLSLVLDGKRSFAFTLARAGAAYYFGDLTFTGSKRFRTLGGANIAGVRCRAVDALAEARTALSQRSPALGRLAVDRLALGDMTDPAVRASAYAEALATAPRCCRRYAEMRFARLAAAGPTKAAIGADSPVFDFPEGPSRFLAWTLPERPAPYTLVLRSVVTSGAPGAGGYNVFSPAILLLDANFEPVFRADDLFAPVAATLFPPRRTGLAGQVRVAGGAAAARYLVVYTTPARLRDGWFGAVPGVAAMPAGALPTGGYSPVAMAPSISGAVEVTPGP